MKLFVFLSVKFMIETAGLCGLLFFAVKRNKKKALDAVIKRIYLFPLLGIIQEDIYYSLGNTYFSLIYVVWNISALWLFWKIEIGEEQSFSGIWISYSVILFQLCQMFVTCLIFALPIFSDHLSEFGRMEEIVSTLLIWSIGILSAFISCSKLQECHFLSFKESLWTQIFLWFTFFAEYLIYLELTEVQIVGFISVGIFILLFLDVQLYFFSFMQSMKERNKKMEQMHIRQHYAIQLQHYEEIDSLYRKLREARHEVNNKLLYVEEMLDSGRYEELGRFFKRSKEKLSPVLDMPDYGNKLINAIFWSKKEKAEEKGIEMDIKAYVPEDIPIEGHHLCSLLGNLIDNALEGSIGVESPKVSIIIQKKGSYLFCSVANTVERDILKENPSLKTTKSDSQEHGYGVLMIRRIAENYQGMVDFKVEKGEFIASVMLLLQDNP